MALDIFSDLEEALSLVPNSYKSNYLKCKRTSDRAYVLSSLSGDYIEVEDVIPASVGIIGDFYSHKAINGSGYVISEGQSGNLIASGKTISNATENARLKISDFVNRRGQEEFYKLLLSAKANLAKENPRYLPVIARLEEIVPEIEETLPPVVQDELPLDLAGAIKSSLNYKNFINIEYIAELLGMDSDEVERKIMEEHLAFYNPETNQLESPDEYLSGNIRMKLQKAEEAAENNHRFERNIEKLKEIMPESIPSAFIQYTLGAAWIPLDIFENFATGMFKTKVEIKYSALTGKFSAKLRMFPTVQVTHTYAGGGKSGIEILNATLNSQMISVNEMIDGRSVKNLEKTSEAQAMQEQMQDEFQAYIRANKDIEERTEVIYNEMYNSHVHRDFRVPELTHYPGASEHYKLRIHQKKAVLRAMNESTLFAHDTGAGKTSCIITTAMELRRLGHAVKPLIAVQNKTYGHFVAEFKEIYPDAVILAPTTQEMSTAVRGDLYHKIRDNDWDAIILPHSQFDMIPNDLDRQRSEIQSELDVAIEILSRTSKKNMPLEYSQLKRQIRSLEKDLDDVSIMEEQRKKASRDSADLFGGKEVLSFEQLEVDALLVDECFPYETPILTTKGMLPIGYIVENKIEIDVLSYNESKDIYEFKKISNWMCKPVTHNIVKITHERGSFVCTENHKILTDIGYVEANKLDNERTITFVDLPMVQNTGNPNNRKKQKKEILLKRMSSSGVFSYGRKAKVLQFSSKHKPTTYMRMVQRKSSQKQTKKVLLPSMCCKIPKFSSWSKGTSNSSRQKYSRYFGYRKEIPSNIYTNDIKQPYSKAGGNTKDESCTERENLFIQRRKREVIKASSVITGGIVFSKRMVRIANKNGSSKGFISVSSKLLQGRYWYSSSENIYRGGWGFSPNKKMEILRSKENGNIECIRVESCEVYEQRNRSGFKFSGAEDKRVYDITVEDNHNYFAGGILVSNCHRYKRLGFSTQLANIRGIDPAKSKRSQSVLLKMRWIQQLKEGKNTHCYTGTPISNTMAEAWTMIRYVRPHILTRLGINHFDQFAKTFGQVIPSLEMRGDGTFKIQSRFAKFQNLPEFIAAFKECTDVVFADDIPEFQADNTIPKLHNGQITQVIVKQSQELKEQINKFRDTLEWYEGLEGMEKRQYNYIPLVIYNRAKQASIDLRLLSPSNVDSPDSKVNQVVKNALRVYYDTGLVQMIFSDLYQSPEPKDEYLDEDCTMPNPAYGMRRFNLFNDIRDKLIAGGVKPNQIAILTEPKYKEERLDQMLNDANRGVITFLLGTTERLGTGVNAQRKLIAIHHVDAPNRPMDFKQRNGRILRQKNLNKEVYIFAYGVEKTLDSAAFQRLSVKQRFINQIMKGEAVDRIMEDAADEAQMTFDEMMAALSDSPHAQQKLLVDNRLKSERLKRDNFFARQVQTQRQLNYAMEDLDRLQRDLEEQNKHSAATQQFFPDGNIVEMKSGGEVYQDHMSSAAEKYIQMLLENWENSAVHNAVGYITLNDVRVNLRIHSSKEFNRKTKSTYEHPNLTYTMPEIGIHEGRHGTGVYVGSNSGFGLIQSIKYRISSSIEAPESIKRNMTRYKVNIEELKRTLNDTFDDTKLVALELELDSLKEKMLAEKNKPAVEQEVLAIN